MASVMFLEENETDPMFEVEVAGEVSLPGIIYQHPVSRELSENPARILVGDAFVITEIDYVVSKGVWKPRIWIEYKNHPSINRAVPSWRLIRDMIDRIFLPGYTFFWNDHGQKPIDWVPKGFSELFDR